MSSPQTPGAVLRKAREDRGLSLRELASITRISPTHVACLEGDEYEAIPGEVFVRGFLRNCARELNLNPEEIIGHYERHSGRKSPSHVAPVDENVRETGMASLFEGSRLPRFTYAVAILAIILGLGLSLLIFGQSDTEQITDSDTPSSTTWEQPTP